MSKPKELTRITDEDCHFIDRQLYFETLAAFAFRDKKINADEYELHRDEHLRQIVEKINAKLAHNKAQLAAILEEERRAIGEWIDKQNFVYALPNDSKDKLRYWQAVNEFKQGRRPKEVG